MIMLRRATPEAVRYACLNFHYAKAVPQCRWAYNVYQNGQWCGCVVFGDGAQHNIARAVGFRNGEAAELERVALNGKQEHTSEVISAALKQIHKDAPHLKAIVSYADQNYGHFGTIYQATNWIYIGDTSKTSNAKPDAFIIRGKRMHPRSVGSCGWKQSLKWLRENIDPNAQEVWGKPKFKYVFIFDKRTRRDYQKWALPYPKKEQ